MATWVALFLARPRGTARAASTSLPFAGVSSGSLSSPEVVVVLQFCLNLFGCASGEHPRSGTRQEKWCLCVPGGFRWVENYLQDRKPASPECACVSVCKQRSGEQSRVSGEKSEVH